LSTRRFNIVHNSEEKGEGDLKKSIRMLPPVLDRRRRRWRLRARRRMLRVDYLSLGGGGAG
jgi:hypothetical protein